MPPPPAPVPQRDALRELTERARRVEPEPAPAPPPAPAPAPPAPLPPATGQEPGRRRGRPPNNDQTAGAPPVVAPPQPVAKKGGRPRKSAVVSVQRKRGRPTKDKGSVDDYVRWLKAAGYEFMLLAPKRAGVDEDAASLRWYGIAGRRGSSTQRFWMHGRCRVIYASSGRGTWRFAARRWCLWRRARPIVVAELRRDQSLCDFFRQNAAGFKRMDAERKAAKRARRVARGGAASRSESLRDGRKKKALALALEARH